MPEPPSTASFSAAAMNLYVMHFPNMNLGRSSDVDLPAIVADNLQVFCGRTGYCPPAARVPTLKLRSIRFTTCAAKSPKEGASLSPASAITHAVPRLALPPQTQRRGEVVLPSFHSPADTATQASSDVHEPSHSQVWPLLGKQQTPPFALEGMPLDYNLDIMEIYQTWPSKLNRDSVGKWGGEG
ncbi:uncharacterized protein SPSK_08013 [Sporothrix schenckii 1099-18]|uniref:Uncharacterized protein n=1 Tax=Sporothrix schenckii 1099-18 TaxID=1397361 RepID=A0A0F2MH49_SPOSC|nr:uncharacterized protein SPSK_08013 [Sporothrix schenckii 1099-18]KJR89013.1 hypothetical protein SPSK_08013 [Sporothrix schenckii 1099-18]